MTTEFLYRYEESSNEDGVYIHLRKFIIEKYTPAGCWIRFGYMRNKFQLFGTRKKFACKTIKEAEESFIARKRKQIMILKRQLTSVEISCDHAIKQQSKGEPIEGVRYTPWGGGLGELK